MCFCTCRWMETNIILRYPWPQTDSLILWYKFLANQVNLTNLWLDTSLHVWTMNKTCFESSACLTPEVAGIRIRLMTMPSKWAYFYTLRPSYLEFSHHEGPRNIGKQLAKRSEHNYLMSHLQRLVKTDCPTNLANSVANKPSWRAAETQRRRSFFIIRTSRK